MLLAMKKIFLSKRRPVLHFTIAEFQVHWIIRNYNLSLKFVFLIFGIGRRPSDSTYDFKSPLKIR